MPSACIAYKSVRPFCRTENAIYRPSGEIAGPPDADHYQAIGKIPTGPLGKTGLLVPELKEYFVAVPPHGTTCAKVLVFAVK
jgi:hypothetical protein